MAVNLFCYDYSVSTEYFCNLCSVFGFHLAKTHFVEAIFFSNPIWHIVQDGRPKYKWHNSEFWTTLISALCFFG
jgi:hypothetical protein